MGWELQSRLSKIKPARAPITPQHIQISESSDLALVYCNLSRLLWVMTAQSHGSSALSHGSSELWVLWVMAALSHGSSESWLLWFMATLSHGSSESWLFWFMATLSHGNSESWPLRVMTTWSLAETVRGFLSGKTWRPESLKQKRGSLSSNIELKIIWHHINYIPLREEIK